VVAGGRDAAHGIDDLAHELSRSICDNMGILRTSKTAVLDTMVGPGTRATCGLSERQLGVATTGRALARGLVQRRIVGLDVHKDSVTVAMACGRRKDIVVDRIPGDRTRQLKVLERLNALASCEFAMRWAQSATTWLAV